MSCSWTLVGGGPGPTTLKVGVFTVTDTGVAETDPLKSEQVKEKVAVAVGLTLLLPEVFCDPDQLLLDGLAEAVQLVAFAEFQLNVTESPVVIPFLLAEKLLMVGGGTALTLKLNWVVLFNGDPVTVMG